MEKKTFFRHMATTDGRRFTVAGHYDQTFDDVIIGVSLCGEHENFSRLSGRNRSAGRSLAKNGTRGKSRISLYEKTMPENYWEGKETKVFHELTERYSKMDAAQLKREFRMDRPNQKKQAPEKS